MYISDKRSRPLRQRQFLVQENPALFSLLGKIYCHNKKKNLGRVAMPRALGLIFFNPGPFSSCLVAILFFMVGIQTHYLKNLPVSQEKEIYIKESRPTSSSETRKKCSTYITDMFREKLDQPHPPTKCGMLQVCPFKLKGVLRVCGGISLDGCCFCQLLNSCFFSCHSMLLSSSP